MEIKYTRARPVGVGTLMFVGDDDCEYDMRGKPGCYNRNAATLCRAGLVVAGAGLLLGKPTMRNAGAMVALLGFLAI